MTMAERSKRFRRFIELYDKLDDFAATSNEIEDNGGDERWLAKIDKKFDETNSILKAEYGVSFSDPAAQLLRLAANTLAFEKILNSIGGVK